MKIVYITDGLPKGGRERRCIQLIKGLSEQHHEIHLISTSKEIEYKEFYNLNCKFHLIKKNKGYLKTAVNIVRHIRFIDPDIVQCWLSFHCPIINIIKIFFHFKYVTSFVADCNYSNKTWFRKLIFKWSFLTADANIANSKAGLISYKVSPNGHVMYNGFDLSRTKVSLSHLFIERINPKRKYIISMIARMQPSKNYQMFIDAAKILLKNRDDLLFLCIGGGEDLNKYIEQTSSNENIKILGQRSDIEELLLSSYISVLCTSNIHKEGISNTILESMAFKKPVIATNGGGTNEIINDSINGFIINNGDINMLIEKIELLINDKILYEKLAKEAYNTIIERFALEKSTKEYINLYNRILKYE